jgi:hypothetical protein
MSAGCIVAAGATGSKGEKPMVESLVAVADADRAHKVSRLTKGDEMSAENTDNALLQLLSTSLSLQQIADILDMPRDDVLKATRTLYARLGIRA